MKNFCKESAILMLIVGVITILYGIKVENLYLIGYGVIAASAGVTEIDYRRIEKELEKEKMKIREKDKLIEKQSKTINRLLGGER